ncbi:hypothetical protein BU24DRAFT_482377 [Aaosphaeria arxii CBS 175.79]|uniref:Uncharacterized protein n=1 Tax=Aaosphaeria arxii CBS 175.79 TaxID=1450172 RepID=A0A6A5XNK9_9PLEO|nr:uncharacterized protein BU24DRAFT_482377 [Aaosphaeria arxii CBS 175.79]KAF2014845.1 hypothetical protein BU24DRAFT_482377 [Aaosphaeria arxii CBS 175.79]
MRLCVFWVSFTVGSLFGLPLASCGNTESSSMASAHNIYLVTCNNRSGSDSPGERAFSAIAYFRNPISNSTKEDDRAPKPDRSAIVSDPYEPWEGVKWRLKVWRDKLFASDISADAAAKPKGTPTGTVKLEDEDYVCFRDGETSIRIKKEEDESGILIGTVGKVESARVTCVADHWCAGLNIGSD